MPYGSTDDGTQNILPQAIGESSPTSPSFVNNAPVTPTLPSSLPNHIVRTEFTKPFYAKQQKRRRVPIALNQRVADGIQRLIAESHVERFQGCNDDRFISPIVITVKRDVSLQLALDSKQLNKQIIKHKYQMPNIEDLIDRLAEIIQSRRSGSVRYPKTDLRYGYVQVKLAQETAVASAILVWAAGPPPVLIGLSPASTVSAICRPSFNR